MKKMSAKLALFTSNEKVYFGGFVSLGNTVLLKLYRESLRNKFMFLEIVLFESSRKTASPKDMARVRKLTTVVSVNIKRPRKNAAKAVFTLVARQGKKDVQLEFAFRECYYFEAEYQFKKIDL